MVKITATRGSDPDDASGQYSGIHNNKYDGAITEEPAGNDDDHSGGGGRRI
jgi:hypothetical protein